MTATSGIFRAFGLCALIFFANSYGQPSLKTKSSHLPANFKLVSELNPGYAPNGPAAYARALLKHGATVPHGLAKLVAPINVNVAEASGPVLARNSSFDREYTSPIALGNPPQTVYLDVDTGSADLWTFTSETPRTVFHNRTAFNIERSTTAQRINGTKWKILYGDNSNAYGTVYHDDVRIGPILLEGATVESAQYVSDQIQTDRGLDGLIGLAYNHSSTVTPSQPTTLDHLIAKGYNKFACDLRYHAPGAWYFGDVETSVKTGPISYQPIHKNQAWWIIDMTTFRIGGENTEMYHVWPILIDSGTSLALLQPDIAARYWSHIDGSYFDINEGGYVFPCDAADSLPDFIFGFANDGSRYTVPGQYINYSPASADWCYGGIQPMVSDLGYAIMGDVFMKAAYIIFDGSKPAVGFANRV